MFSFIAFFLLSTYNAGWLIVAVVDVASSTTAISPFYIFANNNSSRAATHIRCA